MSNIRMWQEVASLSMLLASVALLLAGTHKYFIAGDKSASSDLFIYCMMTKSLSEWMKPKS